MVPEPRRFSTPRPSLFPMTSVMMYLYGDEDHKDHISTLQVSQTDEASYLDSPPSSTWWQCTALVELIRV